MPNRSALLIVAAALVFPARPAAAPHVVYPRPRLQLVFPWGTD